MVECDLAKVDVVGSNPIRRSIRLRILGVKQQSATADEPAEALSCLTC